MRKRLKLELPGHCHAAARAVTDYAEPGTLPVCDGKWIKEDGRQVFCTNKATCQHRFHSDGDWRPTCKVHCCGHLGDERPSLLRPVKPDLSVAASAAARSTPVQRSVVNAPSASAMAVDQWGNDSGSDNDASPPFQSSSLPALAVVAPEAKISPFSEIQWLSNPGTREPALIFARRVRSCALIASSFNI